MNIDEENKAKEFYIKSDINGIHTLKTNMVEINYLDMLKLMHSYSQEVVKNLSISGVSVSFPLDPIVLAKYLHDNYEEIAKRANWQTQNNCKVEFEDLPIDNKNTMILLAGKMILDFTDKYT